MITYKLLSSDQHWEQIQDLLGSVYMTSRLPIAIARTSSKMNLAYPDINGIQYISGAFDGDKLIGYVRTSSQEYYLDGKIEKLVYIGDQRVLPNYRGQNVASRLIEQLVLHKQNIGTRGFCYVNSGNNALQRVFSKVPGFQWQVSSQFTTNSVFLPFRPFGLRSDNYIQILDPSAATVPWINLENKNDLMPHFNQEQWVNFLKIFNCFKFFAHKDEPSKILFSLFNQNSFKKIKIGHYPWDLKIMGAAWNILSYFTKAQPFPKKKMPWRMMDLCICSPDLILDKEILNLCLQESFDSNSHALNFISRINDTNKISSDVSLRFATSLKTQLITWSLDGKPLPVLKDKQPLIDLGFV